MELKEFLIFLFMEMTHNKIDFAILRNYESLPYRNKSNDIDILIKKNCLSHVESIIRQASNIYIAHVSRRSYVVNYYLRNVIDGDNFCLQLDFLFYFERAGVRYIDTNKLLRRSETFNGFKVLSTIDQALVLYLSKVIMHKQSKASYRNFIEKFALEKSDIFIGEIEEHTGLRIMKNDLNLSLISSNLDVCRSIKTKIIFIGLLRQWAKVLPRYLIHLVREFTIIASTSSKQFVYIATPDVFNKSKHLLKGSASMITVLDGRETFGTLLQILKPTRVFTLYFVSGGSYLKFFGRFRPCISSTAELIDYLKHSR